jgi:phosphoribosylformylglycinamidine synthase subunit PurSL
VSWRVRVLNKPGFPDHHGRSLEKEWRAAGRKPVKEIRAGQAYDIAGDLSGEDVRTLAEKLLADPVTQTAVVFTAERGTIPAGTRLAEIWPKPGVADPVAETVSIGARDLGVAGVSQVRAGAVYEFRGAVSKHDVRSFCETFLMNPLIQKAEIS